MAEILVAEGIVCFFFPLHKFPDKCRTTYGYDDLKSKVDEEVREQFVPVPKHLIGSVIGKKGSTIKPIKMQSGARITTQDQADAGQHVGFMVCGTQKQINCAVKLINEKLVRV